MKNSIPAIITFELMWHLTCLAQYAPSFSFIPIPDPLSGSNPFYSPPILASPAIGAAFFDPRFGVRLTRVTTTDGNKSRHEYSRFDPTNRDQSLIILDPAGVRTFYRSERYPYNQNTCPLKDDFLERQII